jgi:lysophospholipase L1-like esterase
MFINASLPRCLVVFSFVLQGLQSFAQDAPKKIDSNYNNTYYQGRMELFNSLTPPKNATVFLGNSITERGAWGELLSGQPVMNRGIGGDNTFGVLARLEAIAKAKPKKLFLLIGINDLSRGLPKEVILNNYNRILTYLTTHTPKTKIYIQSVLPLYEPYTKEAYLKNKKDSILNLNVGIKQVATKFNLTYINLHEIFADANGDLKKEYTADGIHLKPAAYVLWVDFLKRKKYL